MNLIFNCEVNRSESREGMRQRKRLLTEENLLLALALWAFAPDVSKFATLVATLATSGAGSGRSGRHLDCGVNLGDWLASGLGIAKCVSIG